MDNYQIERTVGRGGFGTVHLCQDKRTFKNVIIKEIPIAQMTSFDRQVRNRGRTSHEPACICSSRIFLARHGSVVY